MTCFIRVSTLPAVLAGLLVLPSLSRGQNSARASQTPPVATTTEDCRSYDPAGVTVTHTNPSDYIVWGRSAAPGRGRGNTPLGVFLTEDDANNARALAERFSKQCFIGRRSPARPTRANPNENQITYWSGPSGRTSVMTAETCLTYVPARVHAVDKGNGRWTVTDDGTLTLKFDDRDAAATAVTFVKKFTAHCTIGRFTTGAVKTEPLDYWR